MSNAVGQRCIAIGKILSLPDDADPRHSSVEWTLASIAGLLAGWPETPEWLASALSSLGPIDPSSAPSAGAKPPRGTITSHPLYSALYAQPVEDFEVVSRVAQAAYLASVAILHDTPRGTAQYISAIRSAGLAVRRIAGGDFLAQELLEVLSSPPSLADVISRFGQRETQLANLQDEEKRVAYGLRVLLVDAVEARAPRKRQTSGEVVRQRRRQRDPESGAPNYVAREEEFEPSDTDLEEGAAAAPESPRRGLLTVNVKANVPDTSLSPAQRQWRAMQRARGIAASAQGLMLGSDRLHLVDLEAFERTLERHLTRERVLDGALELGAFGLCASLLTGRPVENLKDFAIAKKPADLPTKTSRPFLVLSESAFVLPGPVLKKAFAPDKAHAKWYRPVDQKLLLPVPTDFAFGSMLMRCAEKALGAEPFAGDHLVSAAERLVTEVNAREGSRITTTRVAEFLQRQILVESGDWADAALVCGSGDANARLYYYSPRHADLLELWSRLWKGVGTGFGRRDIVLRAIGLSNDAVGFGGRGCPTIEGVREVVSELLDHCRKKLRGRRSVERNLLVHNAIALYTVMMTLWHCGARAVNDPVDLGLYDRVTGFLALSDKDTDAYYASRVAWLPPLVQQQIAAYRAHLVALKKAKTDIAWDGVNGLFFFNAEGQPSSISLAALKAALPANYPYRLNAQRHYHRTLLRELGVAGQVVDAHLGHGAAGQESYGQHSCFSPQRLALELGRALTKLSEMGGWQLLNGLS